MKVKIPLYIVELEPNNFHVFVQGVFPDHSAVYWALDTGASKSVFDVTQSGHYTKTGELTDKIYTAGAVEYPKEKALGIISDFSVGRMTVKNLTAALLDLSHINELYSRFSNIHICGLLGGDFLVKYRGVIDFNNKILQLRTPRIRPFIC